MFQFTPVSRRATLAVEGRERGEGVSIHARLATGDKRIKRKGWNGIVSIHARLATGDATAPAIAPQMEMFQFTPVSRRAT